MTLLAYVRPVAEHIKAGVRTYVRTPRSVGDIRSGRRRAARRLWDEALRACMQSTHSKSRFMHARLNDLPVYIYTIRRVSYQKI